MQEINEKTKHRFYKKVGKSDSLGCTHWIACTNNMGYGIFTLNKKNVLAHRFNFILSKGPIPIGFCCLHKCDVPSCVNPEHLFLGTMKDNTKDMVNKKRHGAGEKQPNTKFTNADIITIRSETVLTITELAKKYGVGVPAISRIKNRQRWAHVN